MAMTFKPVSHRDAVGSLYKEVVDKIKDAIKRDDEGEVRAWDDVMKWYAVGAMFRSAWPNEVKESLEGEKGMSFGAWNDEEPKK